MPGYKKRGFTHSFRRRRALKGKAGLIDEKSSLQIAFINVNSFSQRSKIDVQNLIDIKSPDVIGLTETHRVSELIGDKLDFSGYKCFENCRSYEKSGGGLAVLCKTSDGLKINQYIPKSIHPDLLSVNSERIWVTVEGETNKTSICFVYFGCQYEDNRYFEHNSKMYQLIMNEQFDLRRKGHRVLICGDFNSHVGNLQGLQVKNNHPVNENGKLLLDFVANSSFDIINSMCKAVGRCGFHVCNPVCDGTWTWQRDHRCSIIDYALISSEHSYCVEKMFIDDRGDYGGDSDHNFIFVTLRDKFAVKRLSYNAPVKKPVWNIHPDSDWSNFKQQVETRVSSVDKRNVHSFASSLATILHDSMSSSFGFRTPGNKPKGEKFPPTILKEIRHQRKLLKDWKMHSIQFQRDKFSIPNIEPNTCFRDAQRLLEEQQLKVDTLFQGFKDAEKLLNDQKVKVNDLLAEFNKSKRKKNIEKCIGNNKSSIRKFWSFLSDKHTKSAIISMVVDEKSGAVKSSPDEVVVETENYIKSLFSGSFNPVNQPSPTGHNDHGYAAPPETSVPPPTGEHQANSDHDYSSSANPKLKSIDDSKSLISDPIGFMDASFSIQDVNNAISSLSRDKARGYDDLPNECIIFSPPTFRTLLSELFNMIKQSNTFPSGWSHGKLVLIHKRGPIEFLSNYRPLTVNISFVGLYSRLLNSRLSSLVEAHDLLGEIQSGFRPNRSCVDNSFVLNTILWKAKLEGKNVHAAYIDIKKAYDTVNRERLWQILTKFGFSETFINCIKNLYNNDCVSTVVNGIKTRPIYQSRGVRQGCSLSPLLFALYLADLGDELEKSQLGFNLAGKTVSGLLFADDLVVLSRTEVGLKELLKVVYRHCKFLKLEVSVAKSKVIYPNAGPCTIFDQCGDETLTLEKVSQYKYLGVETFASMYRTINEKQKHAIATARRFKGACLNIARKGPDCTILASTLWTAVAIPTILFGCESIPFSEATITIINRIQSQLFKSILSLSISVHNIVTQTEFGIPHFASFLYKRQLNACLRWINLPQSRWANLAMQEHLSNTWQSPYWKYICELKVKLSLPVLVSKSNIGEHVDSYFLKCLNRDIIKANLPTIKPLKRLHRAPYLSESNLSSLLVGIKYNYCPKVQCQGVDRQKRCPVCPPRPGECLPPKASEFHVNWECSAVQRERISSGVWSFIVSCDVANVSRENSFFMYVNGYHLTLPRASLKDCLVRIEQLQFIRDAWIKRFV